MCDNCNRELISKAGLEKPIKRCHKDITERFWKATINLAKMVPIAVSTRLIDVCFNMTSLRRSHGKKCSLEGKPGSHSQQARKHTPGISLSHTRTSSLAMVKTKVSVKMALTASSSNTIDAILSTKRQVNSQELMLKNKVVCQKYLDNENLATRVIRGSNVASCICLWISFPITEGGGTNKYPKRWYEWGENWCKSKITFQDPHSITNQKQYKKTKISKK